MLESNNHYFWTDFSKEIEAVSAAMHTTMSRVMKFKFKDLKT